MSTTKVVNFMCEGWVCNCDLFWPESHRKCEQCGKIADENEIDCLDVEHEFPAHYEVCYDCSGRGTTYLGWTTKDQPAFTREDFDYEGPDFFEDYMSGFYDRPCPTCEGQRVVAEINENLRGRDQIISAAYEEWAKDEAHFQAICEAERRMGA